MEKSSTGSARKSAKCQTSDLTNTGEVDLQIDAPQINIFDDFGDFWSQWF